jgi:hypothetical protein
MPIIQAAHARYDNLRELNRIGFETERDAQLHLRRLESDPEYRRTHGLAAEAYQRALATAVARKRTATRLRDVLQADASVQAVLDAAGVGRLSPDLLPHIIIDRLQVRRFKESRDATLDKGKPSGGGFAALSCNRSVARSSATA